MSRLSMPVSVGELIDRITILALKAARLPDPAGRDRAAQRLAALERIRAAQVPASEELERQTATLRAVNAELWAVEDALRGHERAGTFGPDFIARARSVYRLNDRRAALKQAIDELTGSALREEKGYRVPAGR